MRFLLMNNKKHKTNFTHIEFFDQFRAICDKPHLLLICVNERHTLVVGCFADHAACTQDLSDEPHRSASWFGLHNFKRIMFV